MVRVRPVLQAGQAYLSRQARVPPLRRAGLPGVHRVMRWRRVIGIDPHPFAPIPKRKRHHMTDFFLGEILPRALEGLIKAGDQAFLLERLGKITECAVPYSE